MPTSVGDPALRERVRVWAWAAVSAVTLTAVYVAAYGDLVGRFFSFDDFAVLAAAAEIRVRGPADVLRFFEPWPTFAQYRPLTTVGTRRALPRSITRGLTAIPVAPAAARPSPAARFQPPTRPLRHDAAPARRRR
jgi:hypothetical protein